MRAYSCRECRRVERENAGDRILWRRAYSGGVAGHCRRLCKGREETQAAGWVGGGRWVAGNWVVERKHRQQETAGAGACKKRGRNIL